MMFGTRDGFEYLECAECGTLQIVEIPDLSKYYPPEYYSLGNAEDIDLAESFKRRLAARFAGKYLVYGKNRIGKYIAENKPRIHDNFPASMREKLLQLSFDSEILDFGCGGGRLLRVLRYFGFRSLTGADAFIDGDIVYPDGVRVLKRDLAEIDATFDLVMFHHSFEHLPDPRTSLAEAFRLVKPGKFCLIRIPVVNAAWERYGIDWVQLDAPRHLFLYTEKSFSSIARDAGFEVRKIVYDSTEFQFWASEYYKRDIAMNEPEWFDQNFDNAIFTREEFENWKREAERLNNAGLGDQACFYLQKSES